MKVVIRHLREVIARINGQYEMLYLTKRQYKQMANEHHLFDPNFHPICIVQDGGYTEALLYDQFGNKLAEARAFCGKGDTFNRKLGRKIALGRLKSLAV